MMQYRSLVFACLFFPSVTLAQEVVFSPDATQACVDAGGGSECIGTSANQCMEESDGGFSTFGMNACIEEERAWWDSQLNGIYKVALADGRMADAEATDPDQPSAEDTLREMQRNWIAYRDSTCNYEILDWYGGTGATAAWLGCQMRLTGVQTLYLQSMVQGG
jgi:uncharacterized protein YecT (DUF1311 family)